MDPQQRTGDHSPQQEFKQNLTQYVQYNVAVKNLRQFVQDNKEQYKKVLQEENKQITQKKTELAEKKEQLDKKIEEAKTGLANAQKKIEEGRILKEEAKALRQYGTVKIFCVALGLPVPREDEVKKIGEFMSTYSLESN